MAEKTDEDLMVAYKENSMEAFEILYHRYSKRLYSFLFRKTGEHQVSEEVFQRTFMKLHRSKNRYEAKIPFNKWIFTICQSELVDYKRKEKKDARLRASVAGFFEIALPSPEPSLDLINTEGLTEKEQALLNYRYRDELEFHEIAKKIGLSQSSVRKRLSRLLGKLRQNNGGRKL